MDRQTEITTPGALLNEKGDLAHPGFSRALVQEYRRADVKVSPLRIKEWDYYLVNNGKFALALTVADNGYMGLDSVSLLDLEEGWEITKSPMSFLPLGKKHLPETSVTGDVHSAARGYGIHFIHEGEKRVLIAYMNKFGESALSARVELTECPEDSLVIATPFDKPGHFYYNQKIVGFRASGYVNYNGKTYTYEGRVSFINLDSYRNKKAVFPLRLVKYGNINNGGATVYDNGYDCLSVYSLDEDMEDSYVNTYTAGEGKSIFMLGFGDGTGMYGITDTYNKNSKRAWTFINVMLDKQITVDGVISVNQNKYPDKPCFIIGTENDDGSVTTYELDAETMELSVQ